MSYSSISRYVIEFFIQTMIQSCFGPSLKLSKFLCDCIIESGKQSWYTHKNSWFY